MPHEQLGVARASGGQRNVSIHAWWRRSLLSAGGPLSAQMHLTPEVSSHTMSETSIADLPSSRSAPGWHRRVWTLRYCVTCPFDLVSAFYTLLCRRLEGGPRRGGPEQQLPDTGAALQTGTRP